MESYLDKLKVLLYGLFAYLQIDQESVGILVALMCLDTVFGAIKAVRLGKKFSFKELLIGFILKLSILIIPLVVALLGKQVGYDLTIVVDIVMTILSISEAISIFGNIYSARTRKEIKKIDFISMLLISLRNSLKSIGEVLFEKLERIIKS